MLPGPVTLLHRGLRDGNRPGEIHAKIADYLAAGAQLVWVVDPKTRTVTTYRTLLAPRRLAADDLFEGEEVLPGFRIHVSELFEA